MSLHGVLSDFGVADVFQLIAQQRKTGVLDLEHEDRKRQRRLSVGRAGLSLLLPGAVPVFEGRFARGSLTLVMAGMGVALVMTPGLVPLPFEVGGLGSVVPALMGWLLVVPAYLWGMVDARAQMRGWVRST